jgi:hypothetical protein
MCAVLLPALLALHDAVHLPLLLTFMIKLQLVELMPSRSLPTSWCIF